MQKTRAKVNPSVNRNSQKTRAAYPLLGVWSDSESPPASLAPRKLRGELGIVEGDR